MHLQEPYSHLIYVLYDGIRNSVFVSQVLTPLRLKLETHPELIITIITYERSIPTQKIVHEIIPPHNRLRVAIKRRIPFIGMLGLLDATLRLHLTLKTYKHPYTVIARSPLAGWIARAAVDTAYCTQITVQARGLLAQEYIYTHGSHSFWHRWRARQLERIEKSVYTDKNFLIESVSPALTQYLVNYFCADKQNISLAQSDTPPAIEEKQRIAWRTQVRTELNIAEDAYVYCYSGSIKAWQCPTETIHAFMSYCEHRPKAFFLILTQDINQFEQLIHKANIPKNAYRLLTVKPAELSRYLCASDVGFLLRHNHIINWVSRPTKMLEYISAGIIIEHNNTVGWLAEKNLQ